MATSLVYRTERTHEGVDYLIKIRLSDDCKNGHQDFSITADKYPHGKARTDRNFLGGWAIGDELAAIWPDLAIFDRMHLRDYTGTPMHGCANILYRLQSEPGKVPAYYDITANEVETLKTAGDKMHLALLILRMGIKSRWEADAAKAIQILEEWTGEKFEVDSPRLSNWPKPEEIESAMALEAAGHYTPEAVKARADAAHAAKFEKRRAELESSLKKETDKAQREYAVKMAILNAGILSTNFIHYTHDNTVDLNWLDHGDKMSEDEIRTAIIALEPLGLAAINVGPRRK